LRARRGIVRSGRTSDPFVCTAASAPDEVVAWVNDAYRREVEVYGDISAGTLVKVKIAKAYRDTNRPVVDAQLLLA
jgi:hypothetical protein